MVEPTACLRLFRRERRALQVAGTLGIAPPLLFAGRHVLVRGWIDGVPLHIAKPHGDAGYFRSAKAALRKLHRAGIAHNDLAKEQNWLYADGRAYLTDFQLAVVLFARRGRAVSRRALRGPAASAQAQTPLCARSADRRRAARAGAQEPDHAHLDGDRQETLLRDHPRAAISPIARAAASASSTKRRPSPRGCAAHPQVRDVAIVAYPDRRAGTGLYAFVEGSAGEQRAARLSRRSRRPSICRSSTPCRAMRTAKCATKFSSSSPEPARPDRAADQDRRRARLVGRIVSDRRNLARPLCVLTLISRRLRRYLIFAVSYQRCRCASSIAARNSALEAELVQF